MTDRYSATSRWFVAGLPWDPSLLRAPPQDWLDRRPPTDAEKKNAFFPLVTNGYFAEGLARLSARTFNLDATDVDALAKIHELRAKGWASFERYAPRGLALALVAGVSVLAAQVPEELFARAGWDYGLYRIAVFSVFAAAILVLAGLWIAVRASVGAERRANALCEAVLTHLAIMYVRGDDPRA
jgi:hypothetical protein